jgi:hypothetical protein
MPICIEGIERESEFVIDPRIPRSSHEFAAALMFALFYDMPWCMGLWGGLRSS